MHEHLIPFTDGYPFSQLSGVDSPAYDLVPSRDSSAFTRPLRALLFLPINCHRHLLRGDSPSPAISVFGHPYAPPCFVASKGKPGRVKKMVPVHDIFHQMLPLWRCSNDGSRGIGRRNTRSRGGSRTSNSSKISALHTGNTVLVWCVTPATSRWSVLIVRGLSWKQLTYWPWMRLNAFNVWYLLASLHQCYQYYCLDTNSISDPSDISSINYLHKNILYKSLFLLYCQMYIYTTLRVTQQHHSCPHWCVNHGVNPPII